jgi:tetratricopeptide (TPR) repeat protein
VSSSTRAEVLLWAQRVMSKKGGPAHAILELKPNSTIEEAQAAFYKIARIAHPDLHRNHMPADELELVTSAYARAAGAYQEFRSQAASTQRMKPLKPEDLAAVNATPIPRPSAGPTSTPPAGISTAPVDKQMNSRALLYYRKAEIALRRGDFKGAILQIKMAIASDPASAFLRTALAEVETELRKGP